ncbi:MAG: SRPBCC family protein [Comamonadaceae bacterium]|nr:SRPBCC family protein [Comamonadaceae bacterium]
MPSTPIQATDEITIHATVSEVWPVLADVAGYPRWWPRSLGVRVANRWGTVRHRSGNAPIRRAIFCVPG